MEHILYIVAVHIMLISIEELQLQAYSSVKKEKGSWLLIYRASVAADH